MKRRGLSLPELLVVLAIAATLLGFAASAMRAPSQKAGPQALAQRMVEELGAARARAVATQTPVAVALGAPTCQSLRFLEGKSGPNPSRVVNFQGESPGCKLFVGSWPLAAGLSETRGPGPAGRNLDGFQLDRWLPASFPDNVFVFTPSGAVIANDLPMFDQHYHILVTRGVESSPAPAPSQGQSSGRQPGAFYAASLVSDAYTVTLSPEGWARSTPGVMGASSSLRQVSGELGPASPRLPAPGWGVNHDPVLDNVTLTPLASELLNPGETALVEPDGFVTLEVQAHDPDGDDLRCEWRSQPVSPTTGAGGYFSAADAHAGLAAWQAQAGHWSAAWQWQPPEGAQNGDRYRLICTVSDPRGGTASSAGTAWVQTITVTRRGHLVYLSSGAPAALYRINANGTENRKIADSGVIDPAFSPDGQKVVFPEGPPGNVNLIMTNFDGSGRVALTSGAGERRKPIFSRDGAHLFYSRASDATHCNIVLVTTAAADTVAPANVVVANALGNPRLALSPDGSRLAYEWSDGTNQSIRVLDASSHAELANITLGAYMHAFPNFLDDNHVVFASTASGVSDLWVSDLSGGAPGRLMPGDPRQKQCFGVAPSGTEIAFTCGPNLDLYLATLSGLTVGPPRKLVTAAAAHPVAYPLWRQ